MKRILFATEFSEHAAEVFKYAADLAYFFKAELLVMHAFGRSEVRPPRDQTLLERTDKVVGKLAELVGQNMPELYQEAIAINYLAVNAYPIDAILGLAREEEVDLIVMGMTGMSNALDSILGNTSLNVLKQAKCPVLLIPEKATFTSIDNIVYTLDFEFKDLEAIHYLKNWIKAFDATLHGLHVMEYDEEVDTVLRNMMIVKETFKKDDTIEFDLRYGDFRSEIQQFAKSKQADVVAMISRKRNLISRMLDSNTVKGIAKRIHIPLLVIKGDSIELDEAAMRWKGAMEDGDLEVTG